LQRIVAVSSNPIAKKISSSIIKTGKKKDVQEE
jgi:hypothetical protein